MAVLSVSYDLYRESGDAYDKLIAAIKKFAWCHPVESTWYVKTTMAPDRFYSYLRPHLHVRDKVIISVIDPSCWWSQGLTDDVLEWLHSSMGQNISV